MKRPGSFVFLLITLISILSFVVAAPIPVDFEVHNEVLKRSPETFQKGRLVARAKSYAAAAAHAPAPHAPVVHATTGHPAHPAPAHPAAGHPPAVHAAAAGHVATSHSTTSHVATNHAATSHASTSHAAAGHPVAGHAPIAHAAAAGRGVSYAAAAARAPAGHAPVAHASTGHPAAAHPAAGHTTTTPAANPNERLNANRLKWLPGASSRLTAANHTPAQYGGANPHQAHMAMVHDYVNSQAFAEKYPQHANKKMDHMKITAPLHRNAGDPTNHATVELHTVGGSTHTIHVPGPNRKNSPTVNMG